MRTRASRAVVVLVAALVLSSLPAGAMGKSSPGGERMTQATVRGSFVNDIACVPVDAAPVAGSSAVMVECWGGSTWGGGVIGHTVIHFVATLDPAGRMAGSYEEWFAGAYAENDSPVGIHTRGRFKIDEMNQFIARAKIVGGSCGLSGARGSFVADGNSFNGGFIAKWTRRGAPPPAAGCVPELPAVPSP